MNESKATRHQRLQRGARLSSVVSGGVVLAAVALTPVSIWLRNAALWLVADLSSAPRMVASLTLFVLFVMVLWEAAAFLVSLRGAGGSAPRGAEPASVDDLILAHLKTGAVTSVGALVAAGITVGAISLAGRAWWALTAVLLAMFWAGLLRIGPLVLSRLGSVRPIRRVDLRDALEALARRVQVPVAGIHEWVVADAAPATAVVAGVGPSRRVLVSSEIVRDWADDEIAVVVAHELAHHAYHDLWRALVLNAVVLAVGLALAHLAVSLTATRLGFAAAGDLASLPLVALVAGLVWVVSTPLRHAQSRAQERRADRFALSATGASAAFRTAIRRLGARHLAEERPSTWTRWLHHAHPSVAERLAAADEFEKEPGPMRPRQA